MREILVSERERLDLIQQGDNMFLEVHERLYDAQRQQRQPEDKGKFVTMLDQFIVYGSLDAVTELYLHDDKKMVLDFSASRELAVLKPNTAQRPLDRTSLRWSLFHSPSRLLAKDQDFCYLEVMKPYGTATGRRGWARCSHSIKHAACPEFKTAQGMDINRAELFYCGLFFEETDAVGVLNATVFYNVKRDNIPPVLVPMVLKARAKRSVELVNHYLKMSDMILRSKKVSLTRALQLQGERRCGACATHLSMWKPKDKCVTCGSFMCDKCDDIVARNYRVDGVARGEVVCFSCADRRGKKIVLATETGYSDLDSSGSAVKTHSILEADQDGGLREGSVSSVKNDAGYPSWFDEEGKPSLVLEQPEPTHQQRQEQTQRQPDQQKASAARSSEFIPHETFYLPTDNAEQQRRRCATRVSTRRPAKAAEDDFITRRRSRTTGNSRLSSRAKPTGRAPARRKESPTFMEPEMETEEAQQIDFSPVGSEVGLSLEELNWRMRRNTTNSVPVQPEWTADQGRRASARYHTVDGTSKLQRRTLSARRSSQTISAMPTHSKPSSTCTRYSKTNPCDLSYLASFK